MPTLDNPKHELFVLGLAEGKSATEAYRDAGYEDNRHNAARMNTNEHIQNRLRELQSMMAARCLVTVEDLTRELEQARVMAMADPKGAAAAVAAIMGKAKLHGLLVDRAENTNMNYVLSDEPMTEDEWIAKHCKPEARH